MDAKCSKKQIMGTMRKIYQIYSQSEIKTKCFLVGIYSVLRKQIKTTKENAGYVKAWMELSICDGHVKKKNIYWKEMKNTKLIKV